MILSRRGQPVTEDIEKFRNAPPGTILISPVVSTGYDFPRKDAEWQFICKIPFLDSRAKVVDARQKDDPELGPYNAMQTMEQMAGRPMRDREDQCETFIADRHMDWFWKRYKYLASRNFVNRYREVGSLPAPPPAL
jgi:Rad3-related DNA helicase